VSTNRAFFRKCNVNAIKKNQVENEHNRLVANLGQALREAYAPYNPNQPNRPELLHSSQPRAQYVHILIETDPIRAACVAVFFMRVPVNPDYSPEERASSKDATRRA
jgi:hypothetical protein